MSQAPITPEERFAMIVEALLSNPDVTPPSDGPQSKKGFGESALKIHHKIFAMLVKGVVCRNNFPCLDNNFSRHILI
jgi:hypothetical protein